MDVRRPPSADYPSWGEAEKATARRPVLPRLSRSFLHHCLLLCLGQSSLSLRCHQRPSDRSPGGSMQVCAAQLDRPFWVGETHAHPTPGGSACWVSSQGRRRVGRLSARELRQGSTARVLGGREHPPARVPQACECWVAVPRSHHCPRRGCWDLLAVVFGKAIWCDTAI